MRCKELYEKLNMRWPESLRMEWDNDGLMVAGEREISKILLTLDVTTEAVDTAVAGGFDAVLSHHPLIFRPVRSLESPLLLKIVRAGLTVMSFHTRLDISHGGVNDVLAETLGLSEISCVGELARIGTPRQDCFDDFVRNVKIRLGAPYLEVVRNRSDTGTVMVVGGDGKDFYRDALENSVGTYVTGSMNYNTLVDASNDGKVNVIAAGHYYTETPVLTAMEQTLHEILPSCETVRFPCNPVRYL